MDRHTEDPVGAALTPFDLVLIGVSSSAGGFLLAVFLARVLPGGSPARCLEAYRSAHLRLTEWVIEKRILRFPGAALIDTVRPWAVSELIALTAFLVAAASDRTATGLLRAVSAAALLGPAAAWIFLRGAAREALRSVERDLPVACFLLSLLLESGTGASSGLQETAASIPEGALSRELGNLVRSRAIGVPRGESIETSRERVPVEDYRLFLNHILQGERLGIGLSRSLRELSGKMLERQAHRAETIAQQAAVKMLFPLVFFIFPAVFLVILSPVILGLWGKLPR